MLEKKATQWKKTATKHTKTKDDNPCIRKVEYQVFSTFQSAYEMVLLCFNRYSWVTIHWRPNSTISSIQSNYLCKFRVLGNCYYIQFQNISITPKSSPVLLLQWLYHFYNKMFCFIPDPDSVQIHSSFCSQDTLYSQCSPSVKYSLSPPRQCQTLWRVAYILLLS